jgi:iduronate 2-sulfatase
LRVPLIVSVPDRTRGRTDAIVELADLYPTLSQLAGLEIPAEVQGKSFVSVLSDPKRSIRTSALSVDRGYSLRTADWHYIRYNQNAAELYDMKSDPGQFDNLVGDSQYESVLKKLDQQLKGRLESAGLK